MERQPSRMDAGSLADAAAAEQRVGLAPMGASWQSLGLSAGWMASWRTRWTGIRAAGICAAGIRAAGIHAARSRSTRPRRRAAALRAERCHCATTATSLRAPHACAGARLCMGRWLLDLGRTATRLDVGAVDTTAGAGAGVGPAAMAEAGTALDLRTRCVEPSAPGLSAPTVRRAENGAPPRIRPASTRVTVTSSRLERSVYPAFARSLAHEGCTKGVG